MRKFTAKLLFFFIPVIIFLLFLFSYYLIQEQKVDSKIKMISKYEILLMGDSQMQRINSKLFTRETYNFASSGEHYYFTYNKIKKLVNVKNNNIKQILLGVTVHNFAPVYNRLIDTKYIEGQSSLFRYLYFINLYEDEFIKARDFVNKNMLKGVFGGPDWGGYYLSEFKNPDSTIINSTFETHYSKKPSEKMFAEKQTVYLARIDSICHKNKINLILVSLPYHPLYESKIATLYFNNLKHIVNNMSNSHYISYLNYQINPELMSDAVHLNKKGADLFTKKIIKDLESSSDIQQTDKQKNCRFIK